jgi:hypothetical protein
MLAAARGEHANVERDLTAALNALVELDYPYWGGTGARRSHVVAHRPGPDGRGVRPPLDQAIATLASLGAAPALARARTLAVGGRPLPPPARRPDPLVDG